MQMMQCQMMQAAMAGAPMPGAAAQIVTGAGTGPAASANLVNPIAGSQIPASQLQKMIGPSPSAVENFQWNRWMGEHQRGEKCPIPKWDGKQPAKTLKPWLKELRIWRRETTEPVTRHGLMLSRSFEANSWLKAAADRIPEELLVTAEAWGLILTES